MTALARGLGPAPPALARLGHREYAEPNKHDPNEGRE
jgi:hypothetical protein